MEQKNKNRLDQQKILRAERQDFFINASHELNTPLSSIIGYTEIIQKEQKYIPEFVDIILTQATRMKILLADMMRLAELDEDRGFLDTTFCLKKLGEEIIETLQIKAENKLITLNFVSNPVKVYADRGKLREMIENLIDNAIK